MNEKARQMLNSHPKQPRFPKKKLSDVGQDIFSHSLWVFAVANRHRVLVAQWQEIKQLPHLIECVHVVLKCSVGHTCRGTEIEQSSFIYIPV